MSVTVTVDNLEAVERALREFPDEATSELRDGLEASLYVMGGDLADYPSAPADSTYRRTGDLGRGWANGEIEVIGGDLDFTATLGNVTDYGIYVEGEKQAAIHKGRWPTITKIEEQRTKDIERRLQDAIDKVAALTNKVTA